MAYSTPPPGNIEDTGKGWKKLAGNVDDQVEKVAELDWGVKLGGGGMGYPVQQAWSMSIVALHDILKESATRMRETGQALIEISNIYAKNQQANLKRIDSIMEVEGGKLDDDGSRRKSVTHHG